MVSDSHFWSLRTSNSLNSAFRRNKKNNSWIDRKNSSNCSCKNQKKWSIHKALQRKNWHQIQQDLGSKQPDKYPIQFDGFTGFLQSVSSSLVFGFQGEHVSFVGARKADFMLLERKGRFLGNWAVRVLPATQNFYWGSEIHCHIGTRPYHWFSNFMTCLSTVGQIWHKWSK